MGITASMNAQVRIGGILDPDDSVLLDVNKTDDPEPAGNLGLGLPRVKLTSATQPLASGKTPKQGTMIYNTGTALDGAGVYYWATTAWVKLSSGTATQLATARTIALTGPVTGSASFDGTDNANIVTTLTDNAVTTAKIDAFAVTAEKLNAMGATEGMTLTFTGGVWKPVQPADGWKLGGNAVADGDFIGATNNHPLTFKIQDDTVGIVTSTAQLAWGRYALTRNTGSFNTAFGTAALRYNTTGAYNTGVGNQALFHNINGSHNIAVGFDALGSNTAGNENTAIGNHAGLTLTTGSNNVLIGRNAQAPDPAGDNQINIGNAIYGKDGRIAIGQTSAPEGAALTVSSGALQNAGFQLPKVALQNLTNWAPMAGTASVGMMVFNTGTAVPEGIYIYYSDGWHSLDGSIIGSVTFDTSPITQYDIDQRLKSDIINLYTYLPIGCNRDNVSFEERGTGVPGSRYVSWMPEIPANPALDPQINVQWFWPANYQYNVGATFKQTIYWRCFR
ncbi:hypothetical protein FACS189437_04080 [Bacteroidia bacterium]|nr:hypothetical protein FACS189437_04080 [Bacteroidia bacterium]